LVWEGYKSRRKLNGGELSYEYPAWACSSDLVLKGKRWNCGLSHEVILCMSYSSFLGPLNGKPLPAQANRYRAGWWFVQGQERPAVAAGRNLPVQAETLTSGSLGGAYAA